MTRRPQARSWQGPLNGEMRERVLVTELSALRRKQKQTTRHCEEALQKQTEEQRLAAQDRQTLADAPGRAEKAGIEKASVFAKIQNFRIAASAHISGMSPFQIRPLCSSLPSARPQGGLHLRAQG